MFDAIATKATTAGPDAEHVGHEQIGSGILRNAAGRRVGRSSYTCRWIQVLAGGDARERCTASGRTAEGRLYFAGLTRLLSPTDRFVIARGTGAYRGELGTLIVRGLNDTESLVIVAITPRPGVLLHVGMVPLPRANTRVIARANHLAHAPRGSSLRSRRPLPGLRPAPAGDGGRLDTDDRLRPQTIVATTTGDTPVDRQSSSRAGMTASGVEE